MISRLPPAARPPSPIIPLSLSVSSLSAAVIHICSRRLIQAPARGGGGGGGGATRKRQRIQGKKRRRKRLKNQGSNDATA